MTREDFYKLLYEEILDNFYYYYMDDSKSEMGRFISDYGLKPLVKLAEQVHKAKSPEEKLVLLDQMLNVVHRRSDIANWFVEGGSHALSQLSGTPSEQ
jgi:hypothetical protein